MKYIKYLFLIIIIFLLSGCWNYRELGEISIVGAMGIDVEGDEFKVSVEIINAKKVANNSSGGGSVGDESPYTVYETKAKTIKEALTNMIFEAPTTLYIGHINIVVVGEEAAKKGVKEFMDYLMADTESRKMFPTVVVKNGKASDALKILMPLETVTSANIKASLEAIANINGTLSNRLFDEIVMCLYMPGRHPTISAIEIIGDPKEGSKTDNISESSPKTSIKVIGSGVFKKDKLVGYFDQKESLAYTIIRNHAKTIDISFPCDKKGNHGNVVVDSVKTNLKVKLEKDKPVAEIEVTGRAALPEFNCKLNISSSKFLNKVEKMADKELKKILDKTIKRTQSEYKSDVFGFGERLYKDKNSYWEKNKKNWDKIFETMEYKVKVDLKIRSVDSTIKSAKDV